MTRRARPCGPTRGNRLDAATAALLTLLAITGAATPASAQRARSWPEEKCERYKAAWKGILARHGPRGLGPAFLARHEAFLDSGCTDRADVCPRSDEELETANMLTIAAMNAGMASTFLPFACRGGG